MARNSAPQEPDVPKDFPNVTPDMSTSSGNIRILINAVEDTIKELKTDVKAVKDNRHSDFVLIISIFAAGFVILAGMLIFGYFRLDDKIESSSNRANTKLDSLVIGATKVDTKLEDLLARIPPAQTPAPKR